MFSYHTQSALASERHKAILAEMDAVRRVRQARSGPRYPARGRRTVLRDGSEALVRPVHGGDAPLLADGSA